MAAFGAGGAEVAPDANVAVVAMGAWPDEAHAGRLLNFVRGGGTLILFARPGLEESWPKLSESARRPAAPAALRAAHRFKRLRCEHSRRTVHSGSVAGRPERQAVPDRVDLDPPPRPVYSKRSARDHAAVGLWPNPGSGARSAWPAFPPPTGIGDGLYLRHSSREPVHQPGDSPGLPADARANGAAGRRHRPTFRTSSWALPSC